MALTEHEERVIAGLEAQFLLDDTPTQVPAPRRTVVGLAVPVACLVVGVALVLIARIAPAMVVVANATGFPSAGLTRALGVLGGLLALGSAFALGGAVRDLPGRVRRRPR
jgi:hypothetical protein